MHPAFMPVVFGIFLLLLRGIDGACYDPSPAFPPPRLEASDRTLRSAFLSLEQSIESLADDNAFNTTSFSVEVTSSQSTLWTYHHTARELNSSRPGAHPVDENSFYRIASITKTFTTLGVLHQAAAGNLSLDDRVTKYLPELKGNIPWKDITLRTLASQLSGIPRDWSQGDLLNDLSQPWDFGLPPPNNALLPTCYSYYKHLRPCNTTDLYSALSHSHPVFAPNQHSTYSNTAFELLGLVLANVSSLPYEDTIASSILKPLGMSNGATFLPPPDAVSVLPKNDAWYHDVDQGVHNPTGGLFATTHAMSKFLRFVLMHFNSPSSLSLQPGNWLRPQSFTASTHSYYGMPWEIFRPTNILGEDRKKAVSLYTKSGGVPGYVSIIVVAPEYDLGITIFVAGNAEILTKLRERVTVDVIRAVERVAERQVRDRYGGKYAAEAKEKVNSSITLSYSPKKGLFIEDWISNSTVVLDAFEKAFPFAVMLGARAQLIPTLLFVDKERQRGEKWRILIVPPRREEGEEEIWDEFCITDADFVMYDGRPVNEVVFWDDGEEKARMGEVEFTAFRSRMRRNGDDSELGKKKAEGGNWWLNIQAPWIGGLWQ